MSPAVFHRLPSSPTRARSRSAALPRGPLAEKLEGRTMLSAGGLDPTFSGDGFVFDADVTYARLAEAVAVQADGKVVVVGRRGPTYSNLDNSTDLLVSRFNADGTRDTGFGSGGSVVTDLGGYDQGYAVEVDAAGNLVVGATAHNDTYAPQWVVLRYLPSGAPDASFGNGGRVSLDAGYTGGPGLVDLDLAPGGKIVAGGRTAAGATVVRFNASGQLDSTFDGDGRVVVPDAVSVEGVEAAGDGKVVVAGWGSFPNSYAARLNENGSRDTSFSLDGKVTLAIEPHDVAVDSAGRVVVAGEYLSEPALRRVSATGEPDAAFGRGDGVAAYETPIGGGGYFSSVVIAPGDKPLASGSLYTGGNQDFLTARFTEAGAPDASFNGTGAVIDDFYRGEDRSNAVALAPGGKVIAAGHAAVNGFTGEALARYNPDGTRDNTFDGDGKAVGRFEGVKREVFDVIVQPDRKVVVGGSSAVGPRVEFFLARFNADGSPDNSFEGNGTLTTYFGNNRRTVVRSLLLQPDGKIVAIGAVGAFGALGDVDFALARYHPDGSLDASFGGDGTVVNELSALPPFVLDAALYPGGKIVVSGSPGLVRYNPDGSLDRSFGGNGIVEGVTGQIVVQGDKILVDRDVRVARYNADGSPDPTFASPELEPGHETGGEDDEEAYSTITDMAIAPSGDVIVLGHVHDHDDEREKYALWRLNPDGTLDTTFGLGGRVIYVPDEPYHIDEGEVAVMPDGRIVVDGWGESNNDFRPVSVVVRHNPDGSLDTTFGIDGVALFGRPQEFAAGPMALDPTGDIVVAGADTESSRGTVGWGVARLDGSGTAGSVRLDRFDRIVTVKGELTDDNIQLSLSRGRLFVTLNGRSYSFARTSVRGVRVYGRDGNDAVTVRSAIPDLVVGGGAGNDTLRGGPGAERLLGNTGDDLVDGGFGPDTLVGGAGKDVLDYRSRTKPLRVDGTDNDGEAGENDVVNRDFETLYGGSGADVLRVMTYAGGAVYGGAGNDTLRGDSGNDALWGQDGDDVLTNSSGADYVRGGAGSDTFHASEDPANPTPRVITLDGQPNDGYASEGDNVYTDVEHVVGAAGDDHITGSSAHNRLEGGAGNDTLLGLAGDDTLVGGDGADTLTDTQGNNTFDGGRGADTVNGVTEPSDAVVLQAESAARSGAAIGATYPGYTGSGYVDYVNDSGDWVEFTFNAPSAGRYRLTFRYANGSAADRPLTMLLNGNYGARFQFQPTGSWSQWATNSTDVELDAGTNRIRLTSTGGNGPNLDSLSVE